MSRKPQVVTASDEVKDQLQSIVNRRKSEQRLVERAKIILKCFEGMPLEDIAEQVGVSKVTVSKWKRRFLSDGLQGLFDMPRSGRTASYTKQDEQRVIDQISREPPDGLARWDGATLARELDYSDDFFGKPAHLTVSGQLNGEMYACALGDIYTFGPTFRAENSNTARHAAEFWMIEPEMAFADIYDDMDLAEDMVRYCVTEVMEKCHDDIELFSKFVDPTLMDTLNTIKNNSFARITYTEAIEIMKKSGKKFEYEPEYGIDMQTEHERFLAEEHFKRPVIVRDYPKEIKAFYMRMNDDNKTVAAMDVLVPRIGELIGGSQREERYELLKKRIEELGMHEEDYGWYLDSRKYGSVPHAGFGLGFERMMMLLTGIANIRDVIPFPRTPKSLNF